MMSISLRGVLFLVALLVSAAVLAQDTPAEPTAEQLQKARDDYAKIGATYRAVTDPLTKRVSHSFQFSPKTQDTDLKNLPNPQQDDTTKVEMVVTGASGELKLVLSWVVAGIVPA